ncbi:MAG: hypothetical protein HW407_1518 [Bacteroidetes bacterium]|nr:hypothetical protein [Bacteroidota bacterium]
MRFGLRSRDVAFYAVLFITFAVLSSFLPAACCS